MGLRAIHTILNKQWLQIKYNDIVKNISKIMKKMTKSKSKMTKIRISGLTKIIINYGDYIHKLW